MLNASDCTLLDPDGETYFTYFSEFRPHSPAQTVVEIMFLLVFFVISTIGNTLIIVVICRTPRLRTSINLLILNLSVCELFLSVGMTPSIVITRMSRDWVLGDVCYFLYIIASISGTESLLCMTYISVKRYITICHTERQRSIPRWVTCAGIALTWLLSVAYFAPMSTAQRVITAESCGRNLTFCFLQWGRGFSYPAYMSMWALVFVVAPCIIMTLCYYRVCRTVRAAARRLKLDSRISVARAQLEARLTTMFVCLIVVFVVTWLPFALVSVTLHSYPVTSTTFTATVILLLSNTAISPIVYGYYNEHLCASFRTALSCCRLTTLNTEGRKDTRTATTVSTTQTLSVDRDGNTKL